MMAGGGGLAPCAAVEEPLEPDPELDAAERALLLQIYRELVSSVEGPVVPFPVELMANPAERAELPEHARVVDLAEFRTRRQASPTPDPTDPQ